MSKAGVMGVISFGLILLITIILGSARANQAGRPMKYGCVLPNEPLFGTFVFNDRRRSLRYECIEGYNVSNPYQNDRLCRRNKWTGTDLDCVHLRPLSRKCPELKDPENGWVQVDGYKANHRAHFFCKEGFHLEGSSHVTCQSGKYWDGILPICQSHQTIVDIALNFKDKVVHKLSSATVESQSGSKARLSAGKNGLDIIFLVDTSASIGENSLNNAKEFMKLLVDIFGVSKDPNGGGNGTRYAIVTFSSDLNTVLMYTDKKGRSKEQVKQQIDTIQNTGGGTDFEMALIEAAIINVFEERGSTKAAFIITDAEDATGEVMDKDRRILIIDAAKTLKETSTELFVIGVGHSVDKSLIASIASDPYIKHVFYLDKFEDFKRIGDVISEKENDFDQCGVSGNIQTSAAVSSKGALPWLGWFSAFGADGSAWTCGGALLCDRWFMTAASCVTKLDSNGTVVPLDPNQINLVLGDTKLYVNDESEQFPIVQDILVHDDYTADETGPVGVRKYDIALLDLGESNGTRPILGKYIRSICFPADNVSLSLAEAKIKTAKASPKDHKGIVAGWGHDPENFRFHKLVHDTLHHVEEQILMESVFRKLFPELDEEMFFAIGTGYGDELNCGGDIGAPYMMKMQNKLFSALGLALHTRDCAKERHFSIFLNLQHQAIAEWISAILDGCNTDKSTLFELNL